MQPFEQQRLPTWMLTTARLLWIAGITLLVSEVAFGIWLVTFVTYFVGLIEGLSN